MTKDQQNEVGETWEEINVQVAENERLDEKARKIGWLGNRDLARYVLGLEGRLDHIMQIFGRLEHVMD